MRAGDLNTRITIQRQETAQDSAGEAIKSWVNHATVWSDFRNISGLQAAKNDAQASTVKASARIRWRTDLDHSMRVIAGSGTYTVEAVLQDMKRREYVDLVLERVT
ncbi:phage head closure protein [Comamonas serinivorans]|nr:phage head closure protein [Comamonas serinivorans]